MIGMEITQMMLSTRWDQTRLGAIPIMSCAVVAGAPLPKDAVPRIGAGMIVDVAAAYSVSVFVVLQGCTDVRWSDRRFKAAPDEG